MIESEVGRPHSPRKEKKRKGLQKQDDILMSDHTVTLCHLVQITNRCIHAARSGPQVHGTASFALLSNDMGSNRP